MEGKREGSEDAEKSKLEWLDRPMSVNWYDIQKTIDELNSQLSSEKGLWRLPTKDELVKAIHDGDVDNSSSLNVRWCWTSTKKFSDEEAKRKEQRAKETGSNFDESQLYYVVKNDGEADTAILFEYGLRLVRDVA